MSTSAQSSNDTNRPGLPHSRCVSSAEADVDWALTSTAALAGGGTGTAVPGAVTRAHHGVLFLDEATASLDPASVLMIETIVAEARDQGTRILFITHDLAQARRLADEVVFLNRGRLAEHAPAARFFDRPDSEAARAFLEGRILV